MSIEENATYFATTEFIKAPEVTLCACDSCNWTGMANLLKPIHNACLTPGHEVPAGRCPECEALSYVVKT